MFKPLSSLNKKKAKPESLISDHSLATVYSSFQISQNGGLHLFYFLIFICSIHCIVASALVFCWHRSYHGDPGLQYCQIQRILFCLELNGNLCCIWCCWLPLPPWKSFLPWISSMTLLSVDSCFFSVFFLVFFPSAGSPNAGTTRAQAWVLFSSHPICSSWECIRAVLLKKGIEQALSRPSMWLMNSSPYIWKDFTPYRFSNDNDTQKNEDLLNQLQERLQYQSDTSM